MKKNRMMVKRNKRRGSMILVALFCIILPIMAIYIGLRITELWVSPALNTGDYIDIEIDNNEGNNINTDKEEAGSKGGNASVDYITEVIQPLSIFTIQIASLGDNKNIEGFIGELNANKLSHLIYKADNSYKVYTVGGTKRQHVEAELDRIKGFYPDAYISEVHTPIKKVTYPDNDSTEALEAIINDINEIIKVMDNQGEAWYNYFVKEGELDTYIELLKKQQNILWQLTNKIKADIEFPEGFPNKSIIEKTIAYQEGNINRSIDYVEEDKEGNVFRLHSLYLDSLFRIVEIIK